MVRFAEGGVLYYFRQKQTFEGSYNLTLCVSKFIFLKVPLVAFSSSAGTPGTNFRVARLSPILVFEVCVLPRLKPISPPLKVSAG